MNLFAAELKKSHEKFMAKQKRQARIKREDRSMLREEEFHYTDAPRYANEYYGDVYRATTRFDNDWD